MRVLVACEYSGLVRNAFIEKGHEALSCDLLPSELPGPHYQGDVRDLLGDTWDMLIAFPPCTYLSNVAAPRRNEPGRLQLMEEAKQFVLLLWNAGIEQTCIENPVGYLNNNWKRPDQIIQPWMFGHDVNKRTCLWLRGLPPLMATQISTKREEWIMKVPGSKNQAKIRSKTFEGIAAAMAAQWG